MLYDGEQRSFNGHCFYPPSEEGLLLVKKYAKVLITEIIDTAKKGFRIIALKKDYEVGSEIQTESFSQTLSCGKKTITVNRWVTSMDCIDCSDPSIFSGASAKLVK